MHILNNSYLNNAINIFIQNVLSFLYYFRDITNGRQHCEIPLEDQHTSLNLLLELALQKGSLSSILDAILLLLNLWERRTYPEDNRSVSQTASGPILPFLKHFQEIPFEKHSGPKEEKDDISNCTKMFLNFINLPEDDTVEVDLRQAAVVLLAHLDRLAEPHIPPQSFNRVMSNMNSKVQRFHAWGWLSWISGAFPQPCDAISELNVKQLLVPTGLY